MRHFEISRCVARPNHGQEWETLVKEYGYKPGSIIGVPYSLKIDVVLEQANDDFPVALEGYERASEGSGAPVDPSHH